jgi:NAD(P)-dependent dehydrogenase (short-subunit alcohol dehydrogenase family)
VIAVGGTGGQSTEVYPDLRGRAVLVTGGTGALGRAVVAALQSAGAHVATTYRRPGALAELRGALGAGAGSLQAVEADVAVPDGASAAVEAVAAAHGRLDALVHCAGGYSGALLEATDPGQWQRLLGTNLTSAFLCIRAAMPHMKRQGFGRIVTVASRYALAGDEELAAYSASKGGLVRLTEVAAAEGLAHGVTANAVLPSIIDTPANRAEMPGADASRWVAPEAIARVILFLCSDASAPISGAAIPVYGRS